MHNIYFKSYITFTYLPTHILILVEHVITLQFVTTWHLLGEFIQLMFPPPPKISSYIAFQKVPVVKKEWQMILNLFLQSSLFMIRVCKFKFHKLYDYQDLSKICQRTIIYNVTKKEGDKSEIQTPDIYIFQVCLSLCIPYPKDMEVLKWAARLRVLKNPFT